MTEEYLRNTTADYITGVISALNGIKDSVVLINGPTGCKTYYGFETGQSVIDVQKLWGLRGDLRIKGALDDELLRSQFYMGSAEVPSTNLRYEDFIFGTVDQLKKALSDITAAHDYALIGVVQAPGTSLLSEVIEPEVKAVSLDSGVPYVLIESPVFSDNMLRGYDETIVKILKSLSEEGILNEKGSQNKEHKSVNLFGLGSRDLYVDGDLEEISRLLSLCGIEINCAPGAYCSLDELKDIFKADANIYLSPEKCAKTREYMESVSSIPSFEMKALPIGPDLTESFIRGICDLLGADPGKAIEDIELARSRIFYQMARRTGGRGFTKEFRYAAEGECSFLAGLADYLSGYLGMPPEAFNPLYTDRENKSDQEHYAKRKEEDFLWDMLEELGCSDALSKDISKVKDVMLFGSANTIAHVLSYSGNIYGVETAYPSSGYINVIPKTLLGTKGSLYILEQVLNGKRLLKAWD